MSAGKRADAGGPVDAGDAAAAESQTYEQARDELAQVVATLESGGLSLDESLALWERGEQLAGICGRFLDGARKRVEAALERAQDDAAGSGTTRD